MDSLPPVHLGAIVLAASAVVLLARVPLEKALVEGADIFGQPRSQFLLDLALGLAAGGLAGLFNTLALGFPPFSGFKLFVGMGALAFLLALDSAITRQRLIIDRACTKNWRTPPESVHPMARKLALVAVSSAVFVAALITLILANGVDWLAMHAADPAALAQAKRSVTLEVVYVTGVLVAGVGFLIVRYAENLRRLLAEQTGVLESVSKGDLSRRIPVATADEFGVIAARTNAMIEGLKHRTELMNALEQAKAVQRSLLPGQIPVREGLDMAATASYSGQTGGDYYDFLELAGDSLAVVVADVSGHGVDSALLMASARGFLRQGALCLSDTSRIVTTLNRHLSRDVAGSGHFITLFMLVIDPRAKTVEWVRAGHDPAILYDPAQDAFSELAGRGLPLAVDQESAYLPGRLKQWPAGQIAVLGTDGLWEGFAPDGSMYGKDRLRQVVRDNAQATAQEILDAVVADWKDFLGAAPPQDDLTLAVIRFL
ncbi:Phosphoserine phosphatase RsbU [Fundidesulfovibrio magnetotacticus]|uniref:Phosphoserine phosphatase RsbU n=1 Tax=Fundidesulfovibrio magnetotacticus TaxID=2730080 RepID=A0A6V8LPI6_9BACT|nr:SpoIIE family protein phosphatase [Fundidesulfovibrio magnetotacticus]GFK93644.1 Phosphoserine phosphatase RsbU [Fundidesulfovibrio magnetotacticus]